MTAIRIAMVGPFGLHPNKTMSSRALSLATALATDGNEVALFMPPWQTPQEANRWWEKDGVTLRYTALGSRPLSTSRYLINDVLSWKPDIVHGFKPKAYSGLAMWWLWQFHRHRLRLFLDMDDWEGAGGWNDLAPYTTAQKRFFAWQEQWGMNHARGITVASRELQSIVWSQGVATDQVHYLPNGSGLAMAGLTDPDDRIQARRRELNLQDRPALLVYSRFFEFDTARLAAILAGVRRIVEDLAIIFIGESLYSEDAATLRQELAHHDLLPAVVDLGWVDETELPVLLRSCDVALYLMDDTLINRAKCPVKLADLAGAGVPVVAEEVGQVSAYVANGVTGLLRPSGEVDALVQDAARLLQDEAKRAEFGQAAQDRYNRYFSWEHLAMELGAFYRR